MIRIARLGDEERRELFRNQVGVEVRTRTSDKLRTLNHSFALEIVFFNVIVDKSAMYIRFGECSNGDAFCSPI